MREINKDLENKSNQIDDLINKLKCILVTNQKLTNQQNLLYN